MSKSDKKRAWSPHAPPKLVTLSGAGLSAESGLSTFRDANGLWNGYDVKTVCDAGTWRVNFDAVHTFYNARRQELGRVAPNAAHDEMASWSHTFETVNLTQNADDLLERAGCENVVHLHGCMSDMACIGCGHQWDVGYRAFDAGNERCPKCASRRGVRPGIVMFGDQAPKYSYMRKVFAALRPCDAFLVVGTSGEVVPFMDRAKRTRALSILCNPEVPDDPEIGDAFDHILTSPASRALPQARSFLLDHLQAEKTMEARVSHGPP